MNVTVPLGTPPPAGSAVTVATSVVDCGGTRRRDDVEARFTFTVLLAMPVTSYAPMLIVEPFVRG